MPCIPNLTLRRLCWTCTSASTASTTTSWPASVTRNCRTRRRSRWEVGSHSLARSSLFSAYFFLNSTLYALDDPSATDTASPLSAWLSSSARGSQQRSVPVLRMSHTPLSALSLAPGVRFFLVHAGDCCHALAVDEVRSLARGDAANALLYPLHVFQSRYPRRRCAECGAGAQRIAVEASAREAVVTYECEWCAQRKGDGGGSSVRYWHDA